MDAPAPKREKAVIIGSQGAGKTSLLVRFLYDTFDQNYMVCALVCSGVPAGS